MKTRIFTVVICFVISSRSAQAQDANIPSTQVHAPVPKLQFDQTSYDFGKASPSGRLAGTFTFRNGGEGVLKLDRPVTSCGCTLANIQPTVLQPAEQGQLTFTVSLPKRRAIIEKYILVGSNDPQNPKTKLTVKADYTPLYDVTPASFNLTIHKGQATNVTVQVARTDGKNLAITKVEPVHANSAAWLQTKVDSDPSSSRATALIMLTITPNDSAKYFSDVLNVYADDPNQPISTLRLLVHVVGDVILAPESLYWSVIDAQKALADPARRITVRSTSGEKFEIKNLASSFKEITVQAYPKDDGKSVEVLAKLARGSSR